MNPETPVGALKKATGWSMIWGHSNVCLRDSGHQPASGFLHWNCHCPCLVDSLRRSFASHLRVPVSAASAASCGSCFWPWSTLSPEFVC